MLAECAVTSSGRFEMIGLGFSCPCKKGEKGQRDKRLGGTPLSQTPLTCLQNLNLRVQIIQKPVIWWPVLTISMATVPPKVIPLRAGRSSSKIFPGKRILQANRSPVYFTQGQLADLSDLSCRIESLRMSDTTWSVQYCLCCLCCTWPNRPGKIWPGYDRDEESSSEKYLNYSTSCHREKMLFLKYRRLLTFCS